jgi:hypothetical protein
MARLLQGTAPGHVASVVERLLQIQRRLPPVLGELRDGEAGHAERGTGDVALV